jgi:hypothetical protein
MSIAITCIHCGTSATLSSPLEARAWDIEHDDHCDALMRTESGTKVGILTDIRQAGEKTIATFIPRDETFAKRLREIHERLDENLKAAE